MDPGIRVILRVLYPPFVLHLQEVLFSLAESSQILIILAYSPSSSRLLLLVFYLTVVDSLDSLINYLLLPLEIVIHVHVLLLPKN